MITRKARSRSRLGSGATPMLQLTSLMDIFTTLLLFLLKTFVADGQAHTVTPGVTLPSSITETEMRGAPVVSVSNEWIAVEGEAMLTVADASAQQPLLLQKLHDALVAVRARADTAGDPRLIVQGDRGIEFKVLQRVLYTSQVAGYTQVSLAVLHGDTLTLSQTASPNGKP